jgi:hypothetical protein
MPRRRSAARHDRGRLPVSERGPHAFPWRLMALVAVVVVAASVVAGLLLSRDRVSTMSPEEASIFTPAPDLLPVEKQRQVAILLSVRDGHGKAMSNVLLGVGGDTGFVAELVLPRNLLLPTVPPVQLKDVTGLMGAVRAEEPLEVLLGVQIDATVELDRLAWAGLIDATGARVDVSRAEDPGSFALVLDRVLRELPADDDTVGQLLTGLGSMARTTVPNEDAAHLLAVLGTGLRTTELRRQTLPVTYLRSGPARVAIARQAETAAVVAGLFPKALLQPGHAGVRRVVLQRSGAALGAAVGARLDLVAAGFGVVDDRSAPMSQATSAVLVPDDSEPSMAAGRDAATALGLPVTMVRVDRGALPTVDVRVVLGSDFAPV